MYLRPNTVLSELEEPIRTADWIELNLLTHEESSISLNELIANIAQDPPDESIDSEYREEYSENPEISDTSSFKSGYWQKAESLAELTFSELHHRVKSLGDDYPLSAKRQTFIPNSSSHSICIATFLTLLRSRHLYFEALEDDGSVAGELFEELVTHVLTRFLCTSPKNAVRFGLAGGSRGDGLPSNTEEALDDLSNRVKEPRGDVVSTKSEDFGADTIVWKNFKDHLQGKVSAVAQATISEHKWNRKQPSPKWKDGRLIRWLTPPITVVAFVESLSLKSAAFLAGLGGQFHSLPLDRFRLLHYVRDVEVPSELKTRIESWSLSMLQRLPR